MAEQGVEEFSLDFEPDPTDKYLKRVSADIARERARTENVVAMILVIALVAALPLYLVLVTIRPEAGPQFETVFEKWVTVVGPLAGAAVGFGVRNAARDSSTRTRSS